MHDLLIIGTGPAGLAASIYAARYGLNYEIFGSSIGGTLLEANEICNFPSENTIKGYALAQKMQQHVETLLGKKITIATAETILNEQQHLIVKLHSGESFKSKTLLIATGTKRRRLGLAAEQKFLGKGLSYCATCDALFFRNKITAVIGGSDAATTAALMLAQICNQVYLIYRGQKLRGETAWIQAVQKESKITVIYNTNVTDIKGSTVVQRLILDQPYQHSQTLPVDGVFVEIGSVPNTSLVNSLGIKKDTDDFIIVNEKQLTSNPRVWAAGDCTTGLTRFQQVITACAEGAVAAYSIFGTLKKS